MSDHRKRDIDDGLLVVFLDAVHFPVSRTATWIWVGLSQMGAAVPEVYPTTAGSCHGRFGTVQPPGLGLWGRLRLDGSGHRRALGMRSALAAVTE